MPSEARGMMMPAGPADAAAVDACTQALLMLFGACKSSGSAGSGANVVVLLCCDHIIFTCTIWSSSKADVICLCYSCNQALMCIRMCRRICL
jgi:hypothetical protein